MNKNINIRPYNPQTDKQDIFEVWYENHKESLKDDQELEPCREKFYHMLQYIDGSFEVFVATLGEELIAYQSALPMRNTPLTWRDHAISSTYVRNKYKDSGIEYKLLKKMIQHLPQSNIKLFFGQSKASNTSMIRIGEKLGFKKIGDIPSSTKKPKTEPLVLYVYNVPEE